MEPSGGKMFYNIRSKMLLKIQILVWDPQKILIFRYRKMSEKIWRKLYFYELDSGLFSCFKEVSMEFNSKPLSRSACRN